MFFLFPELSQADWSLIAIEFHPYDLRSKDLKFRNRKIFLDPVSKILKLRIKGVALDKAV